MSSSAVLRRSQILTELAQSQQVNVSQLSERFGVSKVVIRQDLESLERQGLLRRVHGGAVVVIRPGAAPASLPGTLGRTADKERIGRAAAELISPGDRVILDSGTTVLQLARHLSPRLQPGNPLTVLTNSLHIIRELGGCSGIELLLLGGLYLPQFDIVVGPQTVRSLRELRVDKTFIGTKGLTLERGITTSNMLEAETDRAAAEAAAQVILLADSSKIGMDSFTPIVPLRKINKLITDVLAPADFVAALRDIGIDVVLV
jgi:DeoR/GlpR family transcriptional regulator of sugar metabolism